MSFRGLLWLLLGITISAKALALSVGEVLAQTPRERLAYVIGVLDTWSVQPTNVECQAPALNLARAGLWYLESIEAEPADSTLGRMRQVPAALALSLRFDQVCRWEKKH